jgi:hypothetical protein
LQQDTAYKKKIANESDLSDLTQVAHATTYIKQNKGQNSYLFYSMLSAVLSLS